MVGIVFDDVFCNVEGELGRCDNHIVGPDAHNAAETSCDDVLLWADVINVVIVLRLGWVFFEGDDHLVVMVSVTSERVGVRRGWE